jgi:hypothetical protein
MCGHQTVIRGEGDTAVRLRSGEGGADQEDRQRVVPVRRAGTAKRRLVFWFGLAAGVVVIILAAVAAYQLFSARQHLLHGIQDLRSARDTLSLSSTWRDPATRSRTQGALAQAQHEFAAAQSELRVWTPLIDHLGWVPAYGRQLTAASPAADTALATTRSAMHLLDGLAPLWPVLTGPRTGGRSLAQVAAALDAGHREFVAAGADADYAAAGLRTLPNHSGNATLDHATAELRSKLPALRAAGAWLAAAPTVFGMTGASRYLLTLQNAAELRATGGFIGAADAITLRRGSLHTDFFDSTLPHEIDSVPTPLPEALYTAEGAWIFRDSNWSPDFPLSARLERWFYGEDTGRWVDGVIGVVDSAVQPLLAAIGPVYVPAYHRWVDASNVLELADLYRSGTYHGPLTSTIPNAENKQFLGFVIEAMVRRIETLPANDFPALGAALADEIARREIMLYDRRPAVESAIIRSGADGRLRALPGDFLAIVDDNRSYNKLNPYIHEQASYRVTIGADLWLDATLTIRYVDAPSPANLDGAGPGFGLWGSKHDYQDFIRVYVPAGARLESMSGANRWAPAPAYGLTQFAGRLLLREGQTRTVTFRYRVPANVFSAAQFRRYVLTVRHQPGGNLTAVRVSVHAGSGVTLDAGRGAVRAVNQVVALERDAHVQMTVGGDLQPRPVQLPRQTGPADPYVPFTFFRDARHRL